MRIESYEFGRIVIGNRTYTADVILYPDRVEANWWRKQGHELCLDDLRSALAAGPEVLVVGTGTFGRMRVLAETRRFLEQQGIRLVVRDTAAACQAFNELQQEGTSVVAALHLTC